MILVVYRKMDDYRFVNSILRYLLELNKYMDNVEIFKSEKNNINEYFEDIEKKTKDKEYKLIFFVQCWNILSRGNKEYLKKQFNKIKEKFNILLHTHDWFKCINEINLFKLPILETGTISELRQYINNDVEINCIHHFSSSKKNFNNNPINKILFTGGVSHRYPNRITFNKIQNENIIKLEHPVINQVDTNIDNYLENLNNYISSFASPCNLLKGSKKIMKIILAKYFEIPAAGCLLLAHDNLKEELETIGFIDNINCILTNETNYESKINSIINPENKKIIDEIRYQGYVLVCNNHLLEHRKEFINNIIRKYVIQKKI